MRVWLVIVITISLLGCEQNTSNLKPQILCERVRETAGGGNVQAATQLASQALLPRIAQSRGNLISNGYGRISVVLGSPRCGQVLVPGYYSCDVDAKICGRLRR